MPTDTRRRPRASSQARWVLPAVIALVGGLLVGLVVGGGASEPVAAEIVGPGPLVSWGLPILRLIATLAAILTVGLLVYAAVVGPQGRKGVLSPVGRGDVLRAAWSASIWSLASLLTAAWSLAWALGLPLSQTLTPDVVRTYAWDVDSVRALLLVALIAAVIAVTCVFTATVTGAGASLAGALVGVALPALTGHASSLGSHGVAMTSDVVHALAVSMWVGGLLVLVSHAVRDDPGTLRAVPVFRTVATWSVAFLALSGAGAAFARMNSVSELWSTSFGILISLKILLLGALLITARTVQAKVLGSGIGARQALMRFAGIEALLMAAAVGIGVALTQTAYPRYEVQYATNAETLLGQAFPPPPTAAKVFLGWQLEPLFLGLAVLGIGLYVGGVIRLRRRGDSWPWIQTVAWVLGWLFIVWATNAGVATYALVSLKWHMVSHMVMSMVAPILLAMAAPMTLALRALPVSSGGRRGSREWLVWAMHTSVARFVTHPLWALFVFTIGLYGLYYTPLFSWLMSSHVGHMAMQLHFIASGYLFAWVVIQTDPLPRNLPHWQRLLLAIVATILHSFFAVPIMMSDTAFGAQWYTQVQPPWMVDLLTDSREAGAIAWGITEIPTLLLVVAVAVQWARDDTREATRRDRRTDRDGDVELAEYNERLRRLAERDAR